MGPVISHIRVDELQDDTTKFGGYLMGDGYQRANDSFDVDPTMPGQSQSSAYEWKNIKHSFQTLVSTISRYRRQCYISLYLAIVQQFCGQTNVLSYAPLIFAAAAKQDVDVDDTDSAAAVSRSTISIGLVKFVVTVLVICRIERIGRRKLLLAGTSLIVLGLFLLSVAFSGSNRSAGADHSDGTGTYESGANEGGSDSSWSPIKNMKTFHLALPGVLLVVSGYSMSFGPLTWLLTSELFPTDIRGRALGLSTVITYMAAALATRTFLSAQSWMGPSMLFGSYCAITSLGVMFEYLAIPDTGKMNSEQIEQSLNEMIWWKMGTNGGDDPSLEGHPSSLEMGSQLSLHSLT
jgi:MFS family permease